MCRRLVIERNIGAALHAADKWQPIMTQSHITVTPYERHDVSNHALSFGSTTKKHYKLRIMKNASMSYRYQFGVTMASYIGAVLITNWYSIKEFPEFPTVVYLLLLLLFVCLFWFCFSCMIFFVIFFFHSGDSRHQLSLKRDRWISSGPVM